MIVCNLSCKIFRGSLQDIHIIVGVSRETNEHRMAVITCLSERSNVASNSCTYLGTLVQFSHPSRSESFALGLKFAL